ncbi:MAG TPA: hypothetical protein VIU62_11915 [Chloroflexota bacterium]
MICAEAGAEVRVLTRTLHLAKEGNRQEEYEDAFAANTTASRLAVADGASDSYDSGRWARLLVEAFMDVPPAASVVDLRAWLAEPARAWQAGLRYDVLPWNQQAKARLGAHCTLLGVELNLAEQDSTAPGTSCGVWRAIAVGDSCLFHVRGGALLTAFPLAASAAFGTSPALLTTNPAYRGAGVEQLATAEGDLRLGDTLLLATDALAQWFLRRHEQGERPGAGLPADVDFAAFITEQRTQRRLRNDDVTLIIAHVGAAEETSLPAVSTAIVSKQLSDRWLQQWR